MAYLHPMILPSNYTPPTIAYYESQGWRNNIPSVNSGDAALLRAKCYDVTFSAIEAECVRTTMCFEACLGWGYAHA